MVFSDIARVELFHLHVLRLLGIGPIKSHLALKVVDELERAAQ